MVHNASNLSLLLQVMDGNPCKTTIDFKSLDKNALTDKFERRDLLHNSVEQGLVKVDSVLCLVLDFSLRPLLLLCGFTSAGGRGCFCFGLTG